MLTPETIIAYLRQHEVRFAIGDQFMIRAVESGLCPICEYARLHGMHDVRDVDAWFIGIDLGLKASDLHDVIFASDHDWRDASEYAQSDVQRLRTKIISELCA